MRPTDNIRNSFRKLKIQTSPELDKKIHEEISQVTRQTKTNIPANPVLWRIIMKSNLTKFAAAAMVIIAAFIWVHYSGGSIDPASVAFAKAVEAMQKANWIYMKSSQDGENWEEEWISYDLQIHVTKYANGKIIFQKHKSEAKSQDLGFEYLYGGVEYFYDPEINSIFIKPSRGATDEFPILMQEQLNYYAEKHPDLEIEGHKSKKDGKNILVYTMLRRIDDDNTLIYEIIVDEKTDLPISRKMKSSDKNGNVIVHESIIFKYPQEGPLTIYDAGAQKTAKVFNYYSGDTAKIFETSTEKFKMLSAAISAYGNDYEDMWPDTLKDLKKSPAALEILGDNIDNLQRYFDNIEYLGKGKSLTGPRLPGAYDKTLLLDNGYMTNILFSDGDVRFENIKDYIK